MSMRHKITIVHDGKIRTFDQLAQGESKDEFRARAVCAVGMAEGAEYTYFEQHGHPYRGQVPDSCLGFRRVHHVHAQDEALPGLVVFREEKARIVREANVRRVLGRAR
jgi:hypothetical protein